mgnify:FL=1
MGERNLQSQDINENCGLDIIEKEKFGSSPDEEVVGHVRKGVLGSKEVVIRFGQSEGFKFMDGQ